MSAFDTPDAAEFCPECQRERLSCVHMNDEDLRADGGGVPDPEDLSRFQYDLLTVLAAGPQYGLAIKETLSDHYGAEFGHARLYQNLDALVADGLVEKRSRDGRTNEYELTPTGAEVLETRVDWVRQHAKRLSVVKLQAAAADGGESPC